MTLKEIGEQAVKGRLSLLRYWFDERAGTLMGLELHGVEPGRPYPASVMRAAEQIRMFHGTHLEHARTYIVPDEDVLTILDQDVRTFPTATIYPSDMLSPDGFAYFARPITHPVPEEGIPPVQAITWNVAGPDDPYFGTSDPDKYVISIITYSAIRDIPEKAQFPDTLPRLYPTSSVLWRIGVEDGGEVWKDPETNRLTKRYREPPVKLLAAFFAIIRQRLLVLEETPTPLAKKVGHARRRYPRMESGVQVVRMRPRPERRYDRPPTERKLTKRFVVGSFWRWQWYPASEENKPILIRPFEKGPAEAPLTGAHRVLAPAKPLGPKPR
ncbi:hypothetical protein [Microbispora sp. NPDC049633]|uniref:hypothetical protein n=1 Tax=Microbispora sp. NPDC049633 TaxID=3154355 RepID=UPI00344934EE